MKMIMVEDSQTKLDRSFRRQMEMTTMEVFLDFDPVFPGWPPERVLVDAAQEPQKDDPEHRDPREQYWVVDKASAGSVDNAATAAGCHVREDINLIALNGDMS